MSKTIKLDDAISIIDKEINEFKEDLQIKRDVDHLQRLVFIKNDIIDLALKNDSGSMSLSAVSVGRPG